MIFLCIDDDPEDLQLLSEAIRTIDSKSVCHFATDGQQGLEMLTRSVHPDFIFLDINMPLMNGKQTLEAIRSCRAFNEIPVCVLSTSMTSTEKDLFNKIGANFCIKKASRFEEFCTELKFVLNSSILGLNTFQAQDSKHVRQAS